MDCVDSKICIINLKQKFDDIEISEIESNILLLKNIVPNIIKYSPKTILLIATFPFNLMSYCAWKISNIPKSCVIGLGCLIDSIQFRRRIASRFDISPKLCYGWIIGSHLKNCLVPVWSSVSIAGTHLIDIVPNLGHENDPEEWFLLAGMNQSETQHSRRTFFHKNDHDNDTERDTLKLDQFSQTIIVHADATPSHWQIPAAVAILCRTICRNSKEVFAVSTYAKGIYGIDAEVFLALPCIIGANGIDSMVELSLKRIELNQIRKSAIVLKRKLGTFFSNEETQRKSSPDEENPKNSN